MYKVFIWLHLKANHKFNIISTKSGDTNNHSELEIDINIQRWKDYRFMGVAKFVPSIETWIRQRLKTIQFDNPLWYDSFFKCWFPQKYMVNPSTGAHTLINYEFVSFRTIVITFTRPFNRVQNSPQIRWRLISSAPDTGNHGHPKGQYEPLCIISYVWMFIILWVK